MTVMIWIGGGMSVLGLLGVVWCIRKAAWIKGAELSDEQGRTEIGRLMFAHMAAMGTAFLGLGVLVAGILLS